MSSLVIILHDIIYTTYSSITFSPFFVAFSYCGFVVPGESTHLIDPYHCQEESDDEEDRFEASITSKSHLQFSRSPDPSPILQRRNSPIPEITTPRAKQLEAAFNAGTKSSSDSEDQRSITYKTRSISRKAGLSRKGAIAGVERGRLQKSRERANSRSNSPVSHSRSTSPSSNPDMGVADRDTAIDVTSSLLPSIKVSSIPSRPPPIHSSQPDRNSTPESESDSPKKRVIRQMHMMSSTDSESMHVATHEPLAISKEEISFSARTQKPESAKIQLDGGSGDVKGFIEEFKKVKSPPSKPPPMNQSARPVEGEFKKGNVSRKLSSMQEPAIKVEDEFRRVSSAATPPRNPPPANKSEKPTNAKTTKVESSTPSVYAGPPSKPPPVIESSNQVEEEFKKVKSSTAGRTMRTPGQDRKKSATIPTESGSKVVGGFENFGDEFKKVGPRSSPQVAGAGVVRTKAEKPGDEELFKKVSLPRSEQKPVVPVRRKVLPDLPSSGPPLPASPPSHPPPTILPPSGSTPSSGRLTRPLPPSGPVPPLPEKPSGLASGSSTSTLGSNLAEAGKQSSVTSAGSSVPSEYSGGFEVDSGMASPSSLGSTDSMDTGKDTGKLAFDFDKQQHVKEALSESVESDISSRGFSRPSSLSRRNASRSVKRPPPRPNLDGDDAQQPKQGDSGPVHVRPRARSRVIRKRPEALSGGSEDLQQVGEEEESELPAQRRTRARATVVTSADRPRARASSSKTEGDHASKWKADGEDH